MKFDENNLFSANDFIKLFIACCKINKIIFIDINNLDYDLYKYYYDETFKDLFNQINIENNKIKIKDEIILATFNKLINLYDYNFKRIIYITTEDSKTIIKSYDSKYVCAMIALVKKYINDINLKEEKVNKILKNKFYN